jgi:hypothetical protein
VEVRRATGILLIAALLALGSGALLHLHNDAAHAGEGPHDESHCLVHAMMRGPMLSDGATSTLVCLGLFVAFLTMLVIEPASRQAILRLDCRGPPARLPVSA